VRRLAVGAVVASLALLVAAPVGAGADRAAVLGVYGGVGSWLDIFAGRVWSQPRTLVSGLEAHGVRTLYVQTSNYSQPTDLVRPAALADLLVTAHAAGIRVVAWYLPSFTDPAKDARRSLAAIRFRTADGQRFDSFALDIEASLERNVGTRNARLLGLSRLLRRASPPGYPLGAIIPSPVGMRHHPRYWPWFPYAQLARSYDAFLPMAYFTDYTRTPSGAAAYARGVVTAIRAKIGKPGTIIHLIAGIAAGAPDSAFAAFDRAASSCGVDGLSLYDYVHTTAPEWAELQGTTLADPRPGCGG
jgi:hypothetical protein